MELVIENIRAHARQCIGCRQYQRDVMISFMHEADKNGVHDLFLTQEQAVEFLASLTAAVERNAEQEPPSAEERKEQSKLMWEMIRPSTGRKEDV